MVKRTFHADIQGKVLENQSGESAGLPKKQVFKAQPWRSQALIFVFACTFLQIVRLSSFGNVMLKCPAKLVLK